MITVYIVYIYTHYILLIYLFAIYTLYIIYISMLFPRVPEISGTNHPQVWKFQVQQTSSGWIRSWNLGEFSSAQDGVPKENWGFFFPPKMGKDVPVHCDIFRISSPEIYWNVFFDGSRRRNVQRDMSDDGQNMWDFQPDIAVTNVTWYVMLLEICLKIIKDIYIYIHLQMTYIYMIYIYIYVCVCPENNVSTNDNMFHAMSRNVGPQPLRHVRSMWMRSLGMDWDLGGRWGPGARLVAFTDFTWWSRSWLMLVKQSETIFWWLPW